MQHTLAQGDAAPVFATTTETGTPVSLSDHRGSFVVLFFYPKDNTPGCTREACSFRDHWTQLQGLGAKVFGVSTDPAASHQKFIKKHKLPFPLLMDEDRRITEAYGAWGEKKFMGRTFMGTIRKTFLIDPRGRLAHVWEKVKPDEHAAEVVECIRRLKPS